LKEREGLEGLKIREKLEAEEVRPRGKESIEEVPEEEFEETKLELATTVKNARDALKTGKPVLAKDLYKKAANIAGTIGESDSVVRYEQKAEEIEIVQPKKSIEDEGAVRRKITELTSKAEKALQKKKYIEAKNLYEEISELFLQLGEEDAANSFFERASSLKRLI
jgi:phage shock protein A